MISIAQVIAQTSAAVNANLSNPAIDPNYWLSGTPGSTDLIYTSGTDNYTAVFTRPIVIGYYPGLTIQFKISNTNTGPATININNYGWANLVVCSGALAAGDLTAGCIYEAVYDGFNFQLLTKTSSGGGGSVTTVSVVSANGFAGTVTNPGTTPAITLSTSITGLLKGNGTAISAAVDSDITSKLLTGYISGAGVVAATDTILQAFNKLNGNIGALTTGVSSVNLLTGAVALTGTTNRITISAANVFDIGSDVVTLTGAQALSNKTGLISQWTNDSGYITTTGITPAALTKTDDTNVTLTLGGTPATALLQATSLTLGWTGTLADARITSSGTWNSKQAGSASLTSLAGLTYVSTSFVKMTAAGTFALDTNTYLTSSGTIANATNSANEAITDDTTTNATMYPTWVTANTGNLPLKVSSTKISFNPSTGLLTSTGFSGPLTGNVTGNVSGTSATFTGNLSGDVTSVAMTTAIGALKVATGMIQANAVTLAKMDASTSTANQVLLSGSSASPAWSTMTYPATITSGYIPYATGTNVLGSTSNFAFDGTSLNINKTNGTSVTYGLHLGIVNTNLSISPYIRLSAYSGVADDLHSDWRFGTTNTDDADHQGLSYSSSSDNGSTWQEQFRISQGYGITVGAWQASVIAMAYGGTNANLTANNGGIVWSNASQLQILSGTATASKMLISGATATPSWSTYTMPTTPVQGDVFYASSATVISQLAKSTTSNSFVKNSGTSNSPAWSTIATTDLSDYGRILLTSGDQNTTAATAQNITALVTPILTASKRYRIRVAIHHGCSGAGGVKFAVTIPGSSTMYISTVGWTTSSAPVFTAALTTSGSLTALAFCQVNASSGFVVLEGEVSLDATASPTIQIQFCSGTNGQTSTIYKTGTCMEYIQLN